MTPWIQTYTGGRFYPLDPRAEDVHIEDIAHALSNLCRFGGHCSEFYSVAQHSVMVSYETKSLWGLLHDASEAYLVDIPRPIKHTPEFEVYRTLERRVQEVICSAFGLTLAEPYEVKEADDRLLVTESRDLMHRDRDWVQGVEPLKLKIVPLSPRQAERAFLLRYEELKNGTD